MENIVPGVAVTLAPGLRITAPNPGVMTGPGTNSYIIGDETLVSSIPGPLSSRTSPRSPSSSADASSGSSARTRTSIIRRGAGA